jgi:hypothetical protein
MRRRPEVEIAAHRELIGDLFEGLLQGEENTAFREGLRRFARRGILRRTALCPCGRLRECAIPAAKE